jgi:hypothetical protein
LTVGVINDGKCVTIVPEEIKNDEKSHEKSLKKDSPSFWILLTRFQEESFGFKMFKFSDPPINNSLGMTTILDSWDSNLNFNLHRQIQVIQFFHMVCSFYGSLDFDCLQGSSLDENVNQKPFLLFIISNLRTDLEIEGNKLKHSPS